jgi:hypothetical protein
MRLARVWDEWRNRRKCDAQQWAFTACYDDDEDDDDGGDLFL